MFVGYFLHWFQFLKFAISLLKFLSSVNSDHKYSDVKELTFFLIKILVTEDLQIVVQQFI